MPDPLFAGPLPIPDHGFAPHTTTFYARITGGVPPYHATWDFHDGTVIEKGEPDFDTFHTFKKPGFYNVRLSILDAAGVYFETYVAVVVGGSGNFPVITSPLMACGAAGAPFAYQITADRGPILTWGASPLPVGLIINPMTGLISGTPVDAGAVYVTLTAENADGYGGASLSLAVGCGTGAGPSPGIFPGQTFNTMVCLHTPYQVQHTGTPISWVSTQLPAGLSLDSAGVISGTPTTGGLGPQTVTVTADYGTFTSTEDVTIVVQVEDVPVISGPTINETFPVSVYQTWDHTMSPSVLNPPAWDVAGLPPGMGYYTANNTTITIYGTPTTPGSYEVTVSAQYCANSATVVRTITITDVGYSVNGSSKGYNGNYLPVTTGYYKWDFGSLGVVFVSGAPTTLNGQPTTVYENQSNRDMKLFYYDTYGSWIVATLGPAGAFLVGSPPEIIAPPQLYSDRLRPPEGSDPIWLSGDPVSLNITTFQLP